jgi:hypothetical protein
MICLLFLSIHYRPRFLKINSTSFEFKKKKNPKKKKKNKKKKKKKSKKKTQKPHAEAMGMFNGLNSNHINLFS